MVPSTLNSVRMRSSVTSRCSSPMPRRIGTNHLPERGAKFLLIALGLRFHGHADHWVREAHALEDHRIGGIAECVASFRFLHGDERDDVAGARLFDRIRFLGKHLDHAADLFALATRGVLYGSAPGEHARVHAYERQSAVRIVDYLERQSAERLVIRALSLADDVAVFVQRLD